MTLARQAAILTLGNMITRGLGFFLRLMLARWMGAEAMGIMEMANAAGMLALTPVTAGIPSAMSRLTAQRPEDRQPQILRSGLQLIFRLSVLLIPLVVLLTPFAAWLLGDMRTLPTLLTTVPDVLLLGMGSVYCGYCYGRENTLLPAAAECIEQGVRFVLSVGLLLLLRRSSAGITAALPGVAEAAAALAVVIFFRRLLPCSGIAPSHNVQRELWKLAQPTMLSRLCLTGMRALESVLLPVCLRRSGLSAAAAVSQFGLMNGMAMPLMLIPGVATSALCMITTPAITRSEGSPQALRCTMRRMFFPAVLIGLCAAGCLLVGADVICTHLYRAPAMAPLVRFMSPMTLLFAVHQVQMGVIAGLGLQRQSLTGTVLSSLITLAGTSWLAPLPQLRLFGSAMATMAGHLFAVVWDAAVLRRARRTETKLALPVRM